MEADFFGMSFEHCSTVFDDVAKRGHPELVRPTPGLLLDTRALLELLSGEKSSLVQLRFNHLHETHYGFGDASGTILLRLSSVRTSLMNELECGALQKKKKLHQTGKSRLT